MKKFVLILAVALSGCGYSSKNNELTGQVKKVVSQTPLICPERVDADISLGVIRNGVGSMSAQDLWLSVPRVQDQATLKKAAETGALVKVVYDEARVTFCTEDHLVRNVELVK